ncbi:MAG: hypothetical protein KAG07_03580, partial [Candidatus Thalassarchaeum sp.]|nr:hypothetical protein [Candidatus Thalassarchaeum sp.]
MDVPKTQFDIDHVEHSVGGLGGHAFRRITHVSMALIPVIYYSRGEEIAGYFSVSLPEFVSYVFFAILAIEVVRL